MAIDATFNPPSFSVRTSHQDNGDGFCELSDGPSSITLRLTLCQFDELKKSLLLAGMEWKDSTVRRLCRHAFRNGMVGPLSRSSGVAEDRIERISDGDAPSMSEVDKLIARVDEFPGVVNRYQAVQA